MASLSVSARFCGIFEANDVRLVGRNFSQTTATQHVGAACNFALHHNSTLHAFNVQLNINVACWNNAIVAKCKIGNRQTDRNIF